VNFLEQSQTTPYFTPSTNFRSNTGQTHNKKEKKTISEPIWFDPVTPLFHHIIFSITHTNNRYSRTTYHMPLLIHIIQISKQTCVIRCCRKLMVFAFTPLCRSAYRGMNCHKTEKAHKLQTSNIQTTVQTMCFCIPPFDFFFKKKNIVGDDDDDDDDGSLSSMPGLVDRSLSGDVDVDVDDEVLDLVFDDADVVIVDWDVDCVVSIDSTHFYYHVADSPRPIFSRYRAMLKREKERRLNMEFLDMYTPKKLYRKKEEDRCILDEDDRDDCAVFNVDASGALVDRALAPVVDGSVPLPFGAVRIPIAEIKRDDGGKALEDISSTKGTRERDPLSYFDKDTLRIAKQAMQEQVDQKKIELRNLGMDIPNDQTIFEGLNVAESYGFINAAINKRAKREGRSSSSYF
jgi:hypothetical protein